jgi:DNA-binding NarL/FixJ family response regulator
MLLIKDHSKITDTLQTALTNLESKHSITVFKDVELCLKHLRKKPKAASPILFFNLNDTNGHKLLTEIITVRNDKKNKDLPIVVYDPKAALCDEEIFIAGANIYIKKSSDIFELKKVLKKVINMDWYFESEKFNRETFFVSV